MNGATRRPPESTIGIDVGGSTSHVAIVDRAGQWLASSTTRTTTQAFTRAFAAYQGVRLVLDVGTHSAWINRILGERSFEVVFVNGSRVRLIAATQRRNADVGAEALALLVRLDPLQLAPIRHREQQARRDLVLLCTRDRSVQRRTKPISRAAGPGPVAGPARSLLLVWQILQGRGRGAVGTSGC